MREEKVWTNLLSSPRAWLEDNPTARRVLSWLAVILLFVLVQQLFWPAPLGIVVQGLILGGLSALVAFGIALIYRANRIINFAQGDLGLVPATLALLLIVSFQVPYFVAIATGIVGAVILGVLVETLIIRRFFKAPRLILTVATIGLAQIAAASGLLLPSAFDIRVPPQSFPSPFDFSFGIYPVTFHGNHVIAMLAVPAIIVGLVAFFRYTRIGIAVRASADSADRALLLGVPVKHLHTTVWVIATVLATVAMLLRAGVIGLPLGSVLGPALLLRALAAAVIGRMENFPVIFLASLGLGIIETVIIWDTGQATLVDPILFVVVMGALLVQRRGKASRAEDAQTSTWEEAKLVRPIPPELARLPEVRWGTWGLWGLIGAFLLLVPVIFSAGTVTLIGVVHIFGIVAVSLVVLTGWAGEISLGQVAFVGIGAAVAGYVTTTLEWDLLLALAVAGVAGIVVAVAIGLPALRIRGLFLAATTLAFALATSSYLLNREFFDWLPSGRIPRRPLLGIIGIDSDTGIYYLSLAGLLAAVVIAYRIRNSRTGRVLIGTRENERATQAYGANVVRAKLTGFAISGFLAAAAGGLFVHHQQALGIQPFAPEESLRAFTMVVIGGLGSVQGAILGAVYVRSVEWFLPGAWQLLATGAGILLVLMLLPGGIGSLIYEIRDRLLRYVARRRDILVPSLVADMRRTEGEPFAVAPRPDPESVGADGHPDGKATTPEEKKERVR